MIDYRGVGRRLRGRPFHSIRHTQFPTPSPGVCPRSQSHWANSPFGLTDKVSCGRFAFVRPEIGNSEGALKGGVPIVSAP